MASLVILLIVYSLISRCFGSGEMPDENICENGYYTETPRQKKHRPVRNKHTSVMKEKYICRKCGKCMDGLQTMASCTHWSDTKCGGCIYEDFGFVFDVITKSCQHPYVLSGQVSPEDIWMALGLWDRPTTPESSDDELLASNPQSNRPIKRKNKFSPMTTVFIESSEPSPFALTFFGTSIILSLSLFVLIILSCRLKAAQDGVDTLFPCVVYIYLKRICFIRERTHQNTPAVGTSTADASNTPLYRIHTGNIMQQSKDSKFLKSTSRPTYHLRTSESISSFLYPKSSSCPDFFALQNYLFGSTRTAQLVDFYIGDTISLQDFPVVSQNSSAFQPKLLPYDSSIISECTTHDAYYDASESDVSESDISVLTDEYGAWRAFNDKKEIEVYLP